jgi:hypothetical protein
MKPGDSSKITGTLPFALMAITVMFAVMALLVVWSASHRKEYLEKEIIVIIVTSVESVPAPYPHYQP